MQINRRVTNGLAWAGLFIVVGVPAADYVSAQLMGDAETISLVSGIEPAAPVPAPLSQRPDEVVAETPAVQPVRPTEMAVTKPAATTVVDGFLAAGKKLPSYITGGEAVTPTPTSSAVAPTQAAPVKPVAAVPVVVQPTPIHPAPTDPVEVASVTPQKIAPVPMPLSMRPKPAPQQLATQPAPEQIVIPQREVASYDAPVTAQDLEGWETGPLSEYLANQEARNPRSRATVTYDRDAAYDPDQGYDANGFFLNDGPNRRPQGNRYIGPVEEEFYLPFVN